jgi:co-chaperonin GroES (HSP10)
MPNYPTTLFLGGSANAEGLEFGITALPGRVAVLMDEKPVSQGGILLPPSGRLNPDTGTVVGSGVDGLAIGSRVCVRPYDGAWFDNFQGSGRQVRFYGVADDWWTSIVAVLTDSDTAIMPTHDWCLIEREIEPSAFALPNPKYLSRGKCVGMGGAAVGIHGDLRGQSVQFKAVAQDDTLNFKFGAGEALVLVRAENLQAVIA